MCRVETDEKRTQHTVEVVFERGSSEPGVEAVSNVVRPVVVNQSVGRRDLDINLMTQRKHADEDGQCAHDNHLSSR